jgi:hypothetical protein
MSVRTRSASTSTPVVETADASPASLREKFASLETKAIRSWRQAAADIAAGGQAPAPEEVLRLGAILRIQSPGEALDADAEAIRNMAKIEARIARDTRECAAMVEPWGGDRDRLLAEIKATEERLANMKRCLLAGFAPGSDWFKPREQLRRANPRVFPQETRR